QTNSGDMAEFVNQYGEEGTGYPQDHVLDAVPEIAFAKKKAQQPKPRAHAHRYAEHPPAEIKLGFARFSKDHDESHSSHSFSREPQASAALKASTPPRAARSRIA